MDTFIKQEFTEPITTSYPSLCTLQSELGVGDDQESYTTKPLIKQEISLESENNFNFAKVKQEELTIKQENQDSLYVSINQIQQNLTPTEETVSDSCNDELFSCFRCDYQTNKKRYLVDHQKIHAKLTSFTCKICNYTCPKKSNFTRHLRKHTGEKPYNCSICDNNYSDHTSFSVHLKTHSGEKPFSCTLCDYGCLRKGDLVRHLRTHTGEKPYECHLCDYKCTAKGRLNRHVKGHENKRLFTCEFCPYTCVREGNLNNHTLRNHRESNNDDDDDKNDLMQEVELGMQNNEVVQEVFLFNSHDEDGEKDVAVKEECLWEV